MTGTCRRLSNVASYGWPTADSGQLKRDGLPTTNRLFAVTTEKACPVKEHSTKRSILACHASPPSQSMHDTPGTFCLPVILQTSISLPVMETFCPTARLANATVSCFASCRTDVATMRKMNGGLTSVSVMNCASGMMVPIVPCPVVTDGSVGYSSSFPAFTYLSSIWTCCAVYVVPDRSTWTWRVCPTLMAAMFTLPAPT
jgi:hypothetical protein